MEDALSKADGFDIATIEISIDAVNDLIESSGDLARFMSARDMEALLREMDRSNATGGGR